MTRAEQQSPRVWGFLGHRAGDNNQLLALCEALRLPFETRTLSYNWLQRLEGFHPRSLATVEGPARRWLQPPWPDLLITVGRRSVPVAREVKARSGGRTKLVLIGHPRVDPGDFDLVITTLQYPEPKHPNVLILPLAMSRLTKAAKPDQTEREWLGAKPAPHLLMIIGGSTKYHDLTPEGMADAALQLAARADTQGGTLLVTGSPRTDTTVLLGVERALEGTSHAVVANRHPRFPVLVGDASELFVTADSFSMISEAVLTGKPVGLIPATLNAAGRRWLGEAGQPAMGRGRRRDIRRIWRDLRERSWIGTIDAPASGDAEDPARLAAERVCELLKP